MIWAAVYTRSGQNAMRMVAGEACAQYLLVRHGAQQQIRDEDRDDAHGFVSLRCDTTYAIYGFKRSGL
jgi:hypothetical protein